jgi:hypothetical protein
MTPRNFDCTHLNDIFRDFERDGLSMSWVYGNIGRILLEAKISVYGEYVEIHEKVNIHRLKRELIGEDHFAVKQVASYLWSSLNENRIADASEICKFLRGECESYDNMDNFNVVYNFKELTADVLLPCLIPSTIASNIKPVEWKSCSLLQEFVGSQASNFSRENQLHRLHDSTTLYVELTELQIEVCRVSDLLSLVQAKHDSEIQNSKSSVNLGPRAAEVETTKNKGGRPRKSWWPEFSAEIGAQLYRGTLKPTSQKELKEAMETLAESRGWSHGDSTMNEPARLLWNLIKPEND